MLSIPAAVLAVCAVSSGQTVLLDFTAEWCGPCRQMAPIVDGLAAAGMPIRKVDIDREPALAQQHRVEGVPCFVLLVDGREVDRVVGATSRERLVAMCQKAQPPAAGSPAAGSPAAGSPAASSPAAGSPAMGEGGGVPVRLVAGPAVRPPGPARTGRPFPLPPMQGGPQVSLAAAVAIDPPGTPVAIDAAPEAMAAREPGRFEAGPFTQPQPFERDRAAPPVGGFSPANANAPAAEAQPMLPSDPLAMSLAASVRLRIEDTQGHAWGSGTIIDSQENAALILTCGHVFRDSRGEGRITVDLFGPGAPQGLRGYLVSYDLKRDVGLLRIETTGRVPAVRVAPSADPIRPGDAVASIGCASGGQPEVHPSRINSINKFLGPPNLQVAGQPVQGRSGGGLFNRQGEVIGVCNAADPADNEGLYAALGSIHAVLDSAKLTHIYRAENPVVNAAPAVNPAVAPSREVPLAREVQPASFAAAVPLERREPEAPRGLPAGLRPVAPAASPADDLPHHARGRGPLSPLGRSQPSASLRETPITLASQPGGVRGAIPSHLSAGPASPRDHAEVICVIRSLNDPQAKSEVVVLDRASPEFVRQLTAEQEVQRARHMTSLPVPKSPSRPVPKSTSTAARPSFLER